MELSKSLVKRGVLSEEDDIWFVKVAALWDYLDGKFTKEVLQDMVERNREYYNSYANYMSENEIGGVFGEVSEENKGKADGQVKGLGANSGRVTGTARVIEDFSQISRLQ